MKGFCNSLKFWYLKSGKTFYSTNTGVKNKWKSVVGLEVHAQIQSSSKLFSGSKIDFGAPVNTCVSFFDAAIPGTLPVLNKKCVEIAVLTSLALGCEINSVCMFDRKHYFYADLPAGYQITQQRKPIAVNGSISFPVVIPGERKKPYMKTVKLHQLQLEQDSGKSLHDEAVGRSLIDLNRAGVPLMELVFDPDLENGEEAASLVKELILILQSLNACSCRMEEGALRVDANVSLHQKGEPLGTRTEIKNIGSIRNVAQAIAYEIERQTKILNSGGNIFNETRAWDATNKKTISMRDKEVQQDYRFMPEPNLPPLYLDLESSEDDTCSNDLIKVKTIASKIPKLPEQVREELMNEFQVTDEISIRLVNEPKLLESFLKIMQSGRNINPKVVTNFLLNDVLTLCNKYDISIENCTISSDNIVKIVYFIESKEINVQIARIVLQELYDHPESTPEEIIRVKNLTLISDINEIEKLCKECIERNPKAVNQYKKGKKKALFAIAGEIAKLSNQRANMEMVMEKLEELLK